MTVPEIQNDPFLTGNQGHFTNFYPYFEVNQGKSSVKIPPIITLSRTFFPFYTLFHAKSRTKSWGKKKKIPLNNASLHTLPGINTYYKHCYGYGAIYESLYEYASSAWLSCERHIVQYTVPSSINSSLFTWEYSFTAAKSKKSSLFINAKSQNMAAWVEFCPGFCTIACKIQSQTETNKIREREEIIKFDTLIIQRQNAPNLIQQYKKLNQFSTRIWNPNVLCTGSTRFQ